MQDPGNLRTGVILVGAGLLGAPVMFVVSSVQGRGSGFQMSTLAVGMLLVFIGVLLIRKGRG